MGKFGKLMRPVRALIIFLCVIFAAGGALGVYCLCVNYAPVRLYLDDGVRYQTMEGFGMSGAWTFQDIGCDDGAAERLAEMLYGDGGMRMDVVRYNVGAGTKELENGYEDGATRATESFFVSEKYSSPSSFSDPENYDFTRDKAAVNVLDKCVATGNVHTLVLFANSPHYLLTANGRGNATRAYDNNLPEENYSAFADYLLIIADFFRTRYSQSPTPLKIYVSPVNEPQWAWGGENATQEGCHFDPEPLAKFYQTFYEKLCAYNARASADVELDFFESGEYLLSSFGRTKFKSYITEFKKYPFFKAAKHVSVHSYNANNSRLARSRFNSYKNTNLQGYSVHMSEYCVMQWGRDESIDMGLYGAGVMMKDLTMLSASQWCWWLGAATCGEKGGDWYEDGLVYYTRGDEYDFTVTKRYYCFSQFTRFISSGDSRIKACTRDKNGLDGMQVCAFVKPDGRIVAVFINERNYSRKLVLPDGYAAVSATVTDAQRNLQTVAAENFRLPAKSVSTLELEKI